MLKAFPASDLHERLAGFDAGVLAPQERTRALERFFTVPSGRAHPGRYWRVDIEGIVPQASTIAAADGRMTIGPGREQLATPAGTMTIDNPHPRALACDIVTAAGVHGPLFARAFGATGIGATKFGALTTAFAQLGAFVYLPADVAADAPITISYVAAPGQTLFPYTVVLAERGARATVIERFSGGGSFVCGVDEIVAEPGADVTFATYQDLSPDARFVATRAAKAERDVTVAWVCAELGSALAVTDVSVAIAGPGVAAHVTALFFPRDSQHVDAITTIDHAVGDSTSETLVKSAAVDRGQARFLGNIRIAAKAQGSDANLRDDALLLSARAHIDSVPALEIAANDVKAYHGATVGAIDAEQIFYMESRGIARDAAERMIALGFFEPAIAHFPTGALRDELRAALAAKLA
ncbi:MAG TPA: SufD family Fe-S cluster assembly protein [Candidatus Tumulicola sp.]